MVKDEHYFHDHIPSESDHDSGFEGLPVELELGGLYPLQGGGGGNRCPS